MLSITCICTYLSGFKHLLSKTQAYSLFHQAYDLFSVILLFLGAGLHLRLSSSNVSLYFKPSKRLLPRTIASAYIILFVLLILRCLVQLPQGRIIDSHPITLLIDAATGQSQNWLIQAASSTTLSQAAETYRQRYHRLPPPGFDKWYEYATARSTVVIDDYDNIYEDLLPFWALPPSQIRHDTRKIISDAWNELAEVNVRSGKATIGPHVRPTHRWMVDGVLAMLQDFVEWLPDMDLAFNLNDESRIAIPWGKLKEYQETGKSKGIPQRPALDQWSADRGQTWHPLKDSKTPKRPFKDRASANSFTNYGSIACPPDSPARKSYLWDPRNLCTSCAAPHSHGLFLSNWTLSANPCHQPDLAHLHGFYLSPGAFKPSHELLPVFSQSKVHGYSDIRYPSPWNYIDKVKYAPSDTYPDSPFASKKNTLFWRGATSEGLSKHAAWKGMARQRLVHLANNATHPFPILLPHPSHPTSYAYTLAPASSLPTLGLGLDFGIVDLITRCWDWDCENQEAELGLVPPTDFQAHWAYRFLFDLDGTGFSGRFLPFLQSHSLVFKTALFREWWDGRLFAWHHFVPVDVRFHGLISTLAYFAGTKGDEEKEEGEGGVDYAEAGGIEKGGGAERGGGGGGGGRRRRRSRRMGRRAMIAHLKAGERIAEEGREWAAKVLRKADMEVYMFRLLLEWARLTDDRRDEIGYNE